MEDQPVSPEQQEVYFQEQVAKGEKLASQGESGGSARMRMRTMRTCHVG
jgi:hypothetical protein